jgi:hypothetical protein
VLSAERNLLVSRQHAVLIHQDKLARTVHLTEVGGLRVRIAHGKKEVTYIHLMFDAHEVIFAENVPAESFYPGLMAIKMLDPAGRRSSETASPEDLDEMIDEFTATYGQAARIIVRRKDVMAHLQSLHMIA